MSGTDHFLARWAKRKQAVQEAEPAAPVAAGSPEPVAASSSASDAPAPHPLGSGRVGLSPEGGGEESAEPLPDLAELTAESDIAAFLRKGVPEAVRQAALRRIWALDPAIRNFVSPAEYAWDFNDPNSIPGFSSSVEAVDLSNFFSGQGAGAEGSRAHPAGGDALERQGPVSPDPAAAPVVGDARVPHAAGEQPVPTQEAASLPGSPPLETPSAPPRQGVPPGPDPAGSGKQALARAAPDEASDILPRRHGGALPQ